MLAYVARRTLLAGLTMTIISVLTFTVVSLPEGDYVSELVRNAQKSHGDEQRAIADQLREYYGLDQPAAVQYFKWIGRIVTKLEFAHSFGQTYYQSGPGFIPGRSVKEIIAEPLKLTIALTSFTIVITWLMGIPIGIYSAVRPHTVGDYVFTLVGFTGLAVPDFLLGLVLMYVFFAYFDMSVGGLFSGNYSDAPWSFGKFVDLLQHLIIPGIVLGTAGTAGLIRIMRNNLMDEMGKPYVTTARAKGMSGWKVVVKYPVRVAINPFISGIGQMLPALVGGSVIVSVVLSLPTLGPILLHSIMDQDMYLAGAIILLLGLLSVIGILVSDLLLVVVDPRIKLYGK
jgi:peptide/nickel transport system permease protein